VAIVSMLPTEPTTSKSTPLPYHLILRSCGRSLRRTCPLSGRGEHREPRAAGAGCWAAFSSGRTADAPHRGATDPAARARKASMIAMK
jgi:hypothetical protein